MAQLKAHTHPPLIGVTGPDSRLPWAWWATRFAIFLAGGKALRLTPSRIQTYKREKLQGLIIGGGDDIDAALYAEESGLEPYVAEPGRAPADAERDAFEIDLIQHALHTQLPLLGICRGAQLINVVLGGSLHQDIRPLRHYTSNRRTLLPRKTALSTKSGLLYQLIGQPQWRINSLHHQAIKRIGEQCKVTVTDLDGFVQAIEYQGEHDILGVQWHPEYLPYLANQRAIFKHLVSKAKAAPAERLYP
ncbi:gamma-glutamyl-gamma-aminobutyrate hydrolase family protein [Oceanisphaera pacifica]|uniref:Type 1 glutamine amidotransferase n=1 Tax=Oceanisphaera pacifica TaxID=2818389 RepID=A0ABS3NCV2_9GAMM|nr:type 1 glutamine amidotransferase [Oceanisphaera pacifica]MBO1518422.1 type 1 glutamine amidotransferase [Oceanisphaera pacifica]